MKRSHIIFKKGTSFSLELSDEGALKLRIGPSEMESLKQLISPSSWHFIEIIYESLRDLRISWNAEVLFKADNARAHIDPRAALVFNPGKCFSGALSNIIWSTHTIGKNMDQMPQYPPPSSPPLKLESHPFHSVQALLDWYRGVPNAADLSRFRSLVPLQKRKPVPESQPRVHFCHDMAGNYQADRFVNGSTEYNVYNFREWALIDEFCYFSHSRITIPPPTWTAAAHRHGVRMYGTVIVEWDELEANRLVDEWPEISEALVKLAKYIGFEGWLMNFEKSISSDRMDKVYSFLQACSRNDCHCMWYDSLITDGRVQYQCAVTENNIQCFNSSQSMFLDYKWNPEKLASSAALVQERVRDVYVGIDIWGRGTFGGGGLNTPYAFGVAKAAKMSIALFAPAWTWEKHGGSKSNRRQFELMDRAFWYDDISVMELHPFFKWEEFESGGSGWSSLTPPESHNGYSTDAKVTSHKWCRRRKVFDLISLGLDPYVLDVAPPPPIRASLWIKGTPPRVDDPWYLTVRLLASDRKEIYSWTSGERKATAEWRQTVHSMSSYGPGVRFIEWEDGGRDAETWGGHYGACLDAPSLQITLPKLNPTSIAGQSISRAIICPLPFYSNFSTGIGKKLFHGGKVLSESPWNNFSEMSLQMAHRNPPLVIKAINAGITLHDDYENVFDGGNSVLVCGRLDGPESFLKFELFNSEIDLTGTQRGDSIEVEISISGLKSVGFVFALELLFGSNERIYTLNCSSIERPQLIIDRFAPGSNLTSPILKTVANEWEFFRFAVSILDPFDPIVAINVMIIAGEKSEINLNIGSLRIGSQAARMASKLDPVSYLKAYVSWRLESVANDSLIGDVHLTWKPLESCIVHHVDIYDESNRNHWLARSFCDAVTIPKVEFDRELRERKFKVAVVSHTGHSPAYTEITVSFPTSEMNQ